MKLKLTGKLASFRTSKIVMVAIEAGLDLEVVEIQSISETKTEEYLNKNPTGKIPLLETEDGTVFESRSIMRHLARLSEHKTLMGQNEIEKALINQYIDMIGNILEPATLPLIYGPYGYMKYDINTYKKATQDVNQFLKLINDDIDDRLFLVGSGISVADIYLVSIMNVLYRLYIDHKTSKQYPKLLKWFNAMAELQSFKSTFGRPVICYKPFEVQLKETVQVQKKEQQKKVVVNKEVPVKKQEVKQDDLDVFKKKENPLDVLPPTKFNLFDFKTDLVNSTDMKETMKVFWEQYDAEGFSLWLVKYDKYTGEGEKLFLTNNLVGGFMQRLDHFRKYAIAVHGVYGDEPNLDIKGLWLWRGTDIPFEMKDHVSYDYHFFTKLDSNNVEHRQLVEDFWCKQKEDEDVVEGQTLRSFRYFK